MKIEVKTLQQTKFPLEVEPTDTVLSIKERIQKDHGGHAIETQKLIYSGKVLDNAKTIGDYEVKENEFLVLMVTKVN